MDQGAFLRAAVRCSQPGTTGAGRWNHLPDSAMLRLPGQEKSRRRPLHVNARRDVMADLPKSADLPQALAQIDAAAAKGLISPGGSSNLKTWLTKPAYRNYQSQLIGL